MPMEPFQDTIVGGTLVGAVLLFIFNIYILLGGKGKCKNH